MRKILDLHIHSRFSRACSPQLTLENIERACRLKGVDIIACGDFTHPAWFRSLKAELEETDAGSGLYQLRSAEESAVRFLIGTEVSLIYRQNDQARRVHLVVHAPSLAAAAELNRQLDKRFNLRSDGRPILGLSAPEFVVLALSIHPNFLVYPAHIWTPWYSVFGSKSGFNSLEECFLEQTVNIFAFESGLSSDPPLNWRLSDLNKLTLLSSSDAHSLANIGREASVFDLPDKPKYLEIYEAIRERRGILETIEFYPEEGMYFVDGHRLCGFSCLPAETGRRAGLCPVCRKPLVIGVLGRAEELADRPVGYRPLGAPGYRKIVELDKIIAEALGIKSRFSKQVQLEYHRLIKMFGPELHILLDLDLASLKGRADKRLVRALTNLRAGKIKINPGFDGQYGELSLLASARAKSHKSE